MGCAFVFPGQGSQAVGMGGELTAAFPAARAVFDEIDDALGERLSSVIAGGPQQELTLTENAQPALMAVSIAVLRVLETEGGVDLARDCRFVAGHSLGEYSALTAAGSLELADSARLLRTRGQAMQRAVPPGQGGMAALLGVEMDLARTIAEQASGSEACAPGNDNAPGQIVLSGAMSAIDRAVDIARERGVRTRKLDVSAPFHSAMLAPAATVMEEALAATTIRSPVIPVVSNVTAQPVRDPEQIRSLLVEQITALVRWRESIQTMAEQGVDTIIELGAGRILSGLVKRINRQITVHNVEKPGDLEAALQLIH